MADDSGVSVVPCELIDKVLSQAQALGEKGRVLARAVSEKKSPDEIREALKKLALEELDPNKQADKGINA